MERRGGGFIRTEVEAECLRVVEIAQRYDLGLKSWGESWGETLLIVSRKGSFKSEVRRGG